MENENKKGGFSPAQTFIGGIVAGFLVLCTIGFFVMVGVYFKGNNVPSVTAEEGATIEAAGPEQFSQCLDSGKYEQTVKNDLQLGASIGVQGTPATFINGYLISGAYPYDAVKQVIDTLLAGEQPDFDFLKDDEGNITQYEIPELPNVVWKGNTSATVTLVEFSDFECPYCARFVPTVHQVIADYSDKVRFTFRHFPLSFHASAQKAAEAYECAKEQGKWYEMHDELFALAEGDGLSVANYKKAASKLGLK